MQTCWRQPDRERGWHRLRAMWPDFRRHTWFGDYGDTGDGVSAPLLRPASSTRAELAAMEEAFGWVEAATADERKVIAMAISARASGNTRVSWLALASSDGRPDPALSGSADKLRMMYSRGMAKVMKRANRGR
jgi:hypothetical protein